MAFATVKIKIFITALILQTLPLCALGQQAGLTGATLPNGGVRWTSAEWSAVLGLDANIYGYAMRGTWWGLSRVPAPDFDTNKNWAEVWLHPRLNVTYNLSDNRIAYAGLSYGLTRDLGGNAFDYWNQGAAEIENAFIGYRSGTREKGFWDISVGSQPLMLGTGMLLATGAVNGAEWGNAASSKRSAWKNSAIVRAGFDNLTVQGFWLQPREPNSIRSDTTIIGGSIEWQAIDSSRAGIAFLHVPSSKYFYPGDAAPFAFIEQGRQGLNVYHGWSDLKGPLGLPEQLSVRGEFAIEQGNVTRVTGQRSAMQAHAWFAGMSYHFDKLPFAPRLSYGFAYFSGNKPGSDTYGRFDPMYYGNGLDNWWFGANGAYAYLNTNVQFNRVTLDLYPTQQDIIKFQFLNAQVAQIGSPIQFGQSGQFRDGNFVVGPQQKGLSNELMLQYVRLISPTIIFSTYVTYSMPGDAIKEMNTNGVASNWVTVGAGLSWSF